MDYSGNLLKNRLFWVGVLYFAEGFPYGVFYDVFPVYFRQQGVDLRSIGLLGLLGLTWSLKFVWAPAVDYFRHHRLWIFSMDAMMGIILVLFSFQLKGDWGATLFLLFLFALFSATSDIAIDGYTIELLEKRELGIANGIRIAVYRVGILTSGFVLVLGGQFSWTTGYLAAGLILCLAGAACLAAPKEKTYEPVSGYSVKAEAVTLLKHPGGVTVAGLFLSACLWLLDSKVRFSADRPYCWPVLLLLFGSAVAASYRSHSRMKTAAGNAPGGNAASAQARGGTVRGDAAPSLRADQAEPIASARLPGPENELTKGPLFGALFELLQRPSIVPVVLFILLFKLGDTSMGFMVKPFWVDSGFSPAAIGLVSVNVGLALSIAGGIAGGWFTDRFGIFKALWILGLFQAASNLGYAAVAAALPPHPAGTPIDVQYKVMMYGASVVESFTGGLGNGPFLAFLMAIVNKQKAATEYALLSSIFALSRQVSYWASGYGAQILGYAPYFMLTFFLAFPAYLFLPSIRRVLDNNSGK
ncbi:MAG: MFS transporter [Nitrospinae bacterium]|nr:MFS transporter [Nitrospinota bacterium]